MNERSDHASRPLPTPHSRVRDNYILEEKKDPQQWLRERMMGVAAAAELTSAHHTFHPGVDGTTCDTCPK